MLLKTGILSTSEPVLVRIDLYAEVDFLFSFSLVSCYISS